jgi:hypothetical protein
MRLTRVSFIPPNPSPANLESAGGTLLSTSRPLSEQLGRAFDRLDHTSMIGYTSSRNIKSGSMIDRSSNDWQAQRHIDGVTKCQTLNCDQTLIVITGRDRIEFASPCPYEESICGERACDIYVVLDPAFFDCRRDLQRFL